MMISLEEVAKTKDFVPTNEQEEDFMELVRFAREIQKGKKKEVTLEDLLSVSSGKEEDYQKECAKYGYSERISKIYSDISKIFDNYPAMVDSRTTPEELVKYGNPIIEKKANMHKFYNKIVEYVRTVKDVDIKVFFDYKALSTGGSVSGVIYTLSAAVYSIDEGLNIIPISRWDSFWV